MQISLVSSIDHWASLADGWRLLAKTSPFCQREWLTAWWTHYGQDRELRVFAVHGDDGKLIGAAPWYVERAASFGRVLRPLGGGEVCSEYVTLLSLPGFEETVADALALWLAKGAGSEGPLTWDVLALESVPDRDRLTARLITRFSEFGCFVQQIPKMNCWRITLPETWPEYLSLLSKSHRKQINRLFRELCDTGRARLWSVNDACELHRGMQILEELHQRRWLAAGRSGVFASSRFREFLHDAAGQLLPAGAMYLGVVELDGRPAAVDFHLVSDDSVFVYQGGLEPDLADASPGRLITALLIREAIENGRKYVDFLRGDEPYKPHFRAEPMPMHDVHVVASRTGPQLRHGLWRTGMTMKQWIKSGIALAGME